jgi:hypothetical protein
MQQGYALVHRDAIIAADAEEYAINDLRFNHGVVPEEIVICTLPMSDGVAIGTLSPISHTGANGIDRLRLPTGMVPNAEKAPRKSAAVGSQRNTGPGFNPQRLQ